jgi:hypothetical protein
MKADCILNNVTNYKTELRSNGHLKSAVVCDMMLCSLVEVN